MSSYPSEEGIVEYFEGLVEYMRKLGYEDPRDKRIAELQARLDAVEALEVMTNGEAEVFASLHGFDPGFVRADHLREALGGDDVN